ncbi:TfpX/TfpZ family type IV pilin accessory protein [Acinetobacter junii]|uniref:TfpX/TfpZ family type IV pilin accessory protein n=1 Tax=Acinetobacter junii TaxID=40215 RepID=UPI00124F9072|nr:TfpX/TfpZ family type IV pilin accessory protein [Acinetobacter junii]
MSRRAKFFFSHLLISFFITLLFIAIVFLFWYPFPLAKAVGVTYIFLMLIAIDVVVGPILGLFVYKEGKKTLKLDLTVIILLQALALVYGLYNIAKGRPVWIVQNEDRFELVRYNDLESDGIEKADSQFQEPSWLKPQFVTIKQAKTIADQNKLVFEAVMSGTSLSMRPEYYTSLNLENRKMIENARNLKALLEFNESEKVQKILGKYSEADAWLPLKATSVDMTVLINKENGEVVKIVDLRPWS